MKLKIFISLGVLMSAIFPSQAFAEFFIRSNQAGYTPNREKSLVIMAEQNMSGAAWTITAQGAAQAALKGNLVGSVGTKNNENPLAFNHIVDFSSLTTVGSYTFKISFQSQTQERSIEIKADPYSKFVTQALRHLRVMRSGVPTLLHKASHLKDAQAILHQVKGTPAEGVWEPVSPGRTVDVSGGWYDAGDYIKFTLNEAYVTWHLLTAYRENPKIHTKVYSQSNLPDILDEANHGLDFLLKTFPDSETFIVQVGGKEDHSQGTRLPESDALDGKRPAYSAISRVHMGSTAAALALGAKIFAERGDATRAQALQNKAASIFERAEQSDALTTVYEKDATNDFYRTEGDSAMMALAASELYGLTLQSTYLDKAKLWSPHAGTEVSWAEWNFFANFRLAEWDASAKSKAESEAKVYAGRATQSIWGYNHPFTWGTLHRWVGNASTTARIAKLNKVTNPSARMPMLLMTDLVFGRNPWGVSFLFSNDLANSLKNIYGQIYPLLDEFPVGALSEGPGDALTHKDMEQWITVNPNDPMIPFNTSVGVFYDNSNDFMTQEATIGGQADIILLLTLASDTNFVANPDSGLGGSKPSTPEPAIKKSLVASALTWYSYTDKDEGGTSTTSLLTFSGPTIQISLNAVANPKLGYQYAGINTSLSTANRPTNMEGMYLIMNIPEGQSLRVNLQQSSITDYDHYGKTLVGKGQGKYLIDFSTLKQAGHGAVKPFDVNLVNGIDLINEAAGVNLTISVDSLVFYSTKSSPINSHKVHQNYDAQSPINIQQNTNTVTFAHAYYSLGKLEIWNALGKLQATLSMDSTGTAHWQNSQNARGSFVVRLSKGSTLQTQTFLLD